MWSWNLRWRKSLSKLVFVLVLSYHAHSSGWFLGPGQGHYGFFRAGGSQVAAELSTQQSRDKVTWRAKDLGQVDALSFKLWENSASLHFICKQAR